jgi:hypothetical protein
MNKKQEGKTVGRAAGGGEKVEYPQRNGGKK